MDQFTKLQYSLDAAHKYHEEVREELARQIALAAERKVQLDAMVLQNEAVRNTLDTIRFGMQKHFGLEYLKKATVAVKDAGECTELGVWVWYCANHMLTAIERGEAVVRSATEKRVDGQQKVEYQKFSWMAQWKYGVWRLEREDVDGSFCLYNVKDGHSPTFDDAALQQLGELLRNVVVKL